MWCKNGDKFTSILFVIFINAVTTTFGNKWNFEMSNFCRFSNMKTIDKTRGKLIKPIGETLENISLSKISCQWCYLSEPQNIRHNSSSKIARQIFQKIWPHNIYWAQVNKSKTGYVFIPRLRYTPSHDDIEDIFIDNARYIFSCNSCHYLYL